MRQTPPRICPSALRALHSVSTGSDYTKHTEVSGARTRMIEVDGDPKRGSLATPAALVRISAYNHGVGVSERASARPRRDVTEYTYNHRASESITALAADGSFPRGTRNSVRQFVSP